ncbi:MULTISPECIES: hypothetical protein [Sphingobacterium]|uniref:Uncharacterized protein n=1 Tax=Sphingobacterium hotanense TaxID=649196 RepID=A0ABT7NRX2_9SPHI|nr:MULTISPECIES: hypothetical protein [Sphingobacterium]MDM1050009.1 hypothetical protein [Sphingobacterium hotanense]
MKTTLYIFMLLMLGLSSCKKNDETDKTPEEIYLNIEGKTYSLSELTDIMVKYTRVSSDRLVYNASDTTFNIKNYEGLRFRVVDVLRDLNYGVR